MARPSALLLIATSLVASLARGKRVRIKTISDPDTPVTGPYDHEFTVHDLRPEAFLLEVIKKAKEEGLGDGFTYTSDTSEWGLMITSIYGKAQGDGKFWFVYGSRDGKPLERLGLGVSCYQPEDNEIIVFKLEPWHDHSGEGDAPAEKCVRLVTIDELNRPGTQPPYDTDITVCNVRPGAFLLQVIKDPRFSYAGTPSEWGLYVTTIDDIVADANQKQYWQILGGYDESIPLNSLDLGVSCYQPSDNEIILFKLVTWGEVDPHPVCADLKKKQCKTNPDCLWQKKAQPPACMDAPAPTPCEDLDKKLCRKKANKTRCKVVKTKVGGQKVKSCVSQ